MPNSYYTAPISRWGDISGDINTQTDLKDALDSKSNSNHDHASIYEPKNSNIQSHISSQSNPHQVTKQQIGLSNVSNDSQIKSEQLENSISDTPNRVPSSSAVISYAEPKINKNSAFNKNFGNSSDTIFEGIEGERLKGVIIDKDYYWRRNIKQIAFCESNESWRNGNWDSSNGTYSFDTTNYKTGASSVNMDCTANLYGATLPVSLDLTSFHDASNSSTTDYIQLALYITQSNLDNILTGNGIKLLFPCDNSPTLSNYYSYVILKSILASGWNFISIQKNSFTSNGSPSWANIKGISIISYNSGQSSTVNFSVDNIQLVRKDPSSNLANPFQKLKNNSQTRDFIISSGNWTVTQEFGKTIFKAFSSSSLIYSVATYLDVTCEMNCLILDNSYFYALGLIFGSSNANRIEVCIYNNNLYVNEYQNWSLVSSANRPFSINSGDILHFQFERNGNTFSVSCFKNTDSENKTFISNQITQTGLVGIYIRRDVYKFAIFSLEMGMTTSAAHSKSSEISNLLNIKYKDSAYTSNELIYGQIGIDTTNNRLYLRKDNSNVYYVNLT